MHAEATMRNVRWFQRGRSWFAIAATLCSFIAPVHLAAQQADEQQALAAPQAGAAPPLASGAAQQANQQPIAQPPRPSPSPPPVGLTGQMNGWLQIRGEFRGRLEGFTGGSYRPDNSDAYMLDRFRFNAIVTPSRVAKFVVQVQDARTFDKTTGGQAVPFRDTLDLRMAYGEFGGAHNMIRGGRQELAFGEERLIGSLPWTNTARSFDGVRTTVSRRPFKFDAFAASVVGLEPETFDKSGHGNMLYGFYGSSTAAIPKATVEPYLFWRMSEDLPLETGGLGDIRQATIGARLVGKLAADLDYGVEMAAQTGSVSTDDLNAWAGHWIVGKAFAGARSKPRTFIEFNYASGDRDPKDGNRGTFDQLYPTGHDKLGLADQVGWRNVEHLRGGVELKPKAQWQIAGSYHSFWLASATDALYNAAGTAVARAADGSGGRRVGQELDVQAAYIYSQQLQIAGGYAYMMPGRFLKTTTPGEAYSYTYLMVTYVFIGDRPATPGGGQPR
jgi:Alginate export